MKINENDRRKSEKGQKGKTTSGITFTQGTMNAPYRGGAHTGPVPRQDTLFYPPPYEERHVS